MDHRKRVRKEFYLSDRWDIAIIADKKTNHYNMLISKLHYPQISKNDYPLKG